MPIFTKVFDLGLQEEFERALGKDDYEGADAVLKAFPPSQDPRALPEYM